MPTAELFVITEETEDGGGIRLYFGRCSYRDHGNARETLQKPYWSLCPRSRMKKTLLSQKPHGKKGQEHSVNSLARMSERLGYILTFPWQNRDILKPPI